MALLDKNAVAITATAFVKVPLDDAQTLFGYGRIKEILVPASGKTIVVVGTGFAEVRCEHDLIEVITDPRDDVDPTKTYTASTEFVSIKHALL